MSTFTLHKADGPAVLKLACKYRSNRKKTLHCVTPGVNQPDHGVNHAVCQSLNTPTASAPGFILSWSFTVFKFILGLGGGLWSCDRGQKESWWHSVCLWCSSRRLVHSGGPSEYSAWLPDCSPEWEPQSGCGARRPRQTPGLLRQGRRAAGGEKPCSCVLSLVWGQISASSSASSLFCYL